MTSEFTKKDKVCLGVISDTHGLLRPEAVKALDGVDLIVHAGDIGRESILEELCSLAPVIAVRGNMDREAWAYRLPPFDAVELKHVMIYVIHDLGRLDIDPSAAEISIVISGHSHKPRVRSQGRVLYLNPGSAGPRRFRLPVSVALLHINGKKAKAEIVELKV